MADIAVYGPIQGKYLCHLQKDFHDGQRPQIDTANDQEKQVFSPLKPETTAAEKDGYFLFKTEDANDKNIKLIINGLENRVTPSIDKKTLLILEEMFGKVRNEDEKVLIQKMIDEVEFKTTQKLSDRANLLTTDERTTIRKKRREEVRALEIRKLGSNKSDRGLLRRWASQEAQKKSINSKELDMEDVNLIVTEIEKDEENKEDENLPECFVLQATSLEATMLSAKEFQNKGKIDREPKEYLKHFGLNGIPIVHDLGNYTDPMNIGINGGVKDVAHGKSFCLNQSSLWHAAILNQVEALSLHSGLENSFTAVVPIKSWNNTKVWSAYRKTRLGKVGISAHLRGTATPLPNDQIALTCAALMKTIKLWENPTEAQADLMADLLDTMQYNKTKPQMLAEDNFMKNPDNHIINEMSSELAPVAMILGSKDMIEFAGTTESRDMWRAAISNGIYWNVRRSGYCNKTKKRKKDIVKNIVNFETKSINKELLNEFDVDTDHYAKISAISKKFNTELGHNISPRLFENITIRTEDFEKWVAGYDFGLFKAVEVVKAHLCKKSSWRWDKKKSKVNEKYPYFNCEEEAWKWLEDTIKKISKKEEEREYYEANKHRDLIKFFEVCKDLSFPEFSSELQKNIPDEFNKYKISNKKTSFCINEVYVRLSKENTKDLKDKFLLLLFGRVNGAEWNKGEFLRNDEMAEQILKDLIPLLGEKDLEDLSFNSQWLKDMEGSLKNKFAKHWYRTKGSRKNYDNQHPSFWAITGYTDPWSFLKTDKNGYLEFKEKLKDLDQREPSQQSFYKQWHHLLKVEPTKDFTMGQKLRRHSIQRTCSSSSTIDAVSFNSQRTKADLLEELNQKFVSIYPYSTDKSNGFNSLLKCLDITENHTKSDKEMTKITENWKNIVNCLLDKDEAATLIHSIQEAFSLNETSFMAFTAFGFIRKKMTTTEITIAKKQNLKSLLKNVSNEKCENTMEPQHIYIPKGKIMEKEFIIFEKDHLDILEELLPMKYIELKKAINFIYEKEHTKRMALTLHILKRYASMKFTSMEAFESLIQQRNENQALLKKEDKYCEPSVYFQMNFNPEDGDSNSIKDTLSQVLHDVKSKDNLILWLNQAYEREYKKNSWRPLKKKITKNELKQTSITITEVWYGGVFHQLIHINFFNNGTGPPTTDEERERLTELTNFFHLALTHAYQIIPTVGAFNFNGSVYEVKKVLKTPEERAEKVVLTIKELWKALELDEKMRDDAASIFRTLGNLGVPYNTSEQILDLLKKVEINEEGQEVKKFKEEDRMEITVEEVENTNVSVVHRNRFYVWPFQEMRLKDLPENEIVGKIRNILADALIKKSRVGLFDEIYDALVHEYIPGTDLMPVGKVEDLMREMRSMKDEPRGRITKILQAFTDNNGTLGRLVDKFTKLSEDYKANHTGLDTAVQKICNDINDLTSVYYQQSRTQRTCLKVITTMDKFIDFLKESKGNYAVQNHPNMTKSELYERIRRLEVKPGDQIWMLRKNYGLCYAHAGIYDATSTSKYLIHVQPRTNVLINKGGKIVCDDLEAAVHANDKIFVIRCFQKRSQQEKILKNAFACVHQKLKFKYSAYHGSCQTFCSKVCGVDTLIEMNPEMSFTDANWFKRTVASKFMGDCNAPLDLVHTLQENLAGVERCVPYDNDEELMDVCNDHPHLSRQNSNEYHYSASRQTSVRSMLSQSSTSTQDSQDSFGS